MEQTYIYVIIIAVIVLLISSCIWSMSSSVKPETSNVDLIALKDLEKAKQEKVNENDYIMEGKFVKENDESGETEESE